MKNTLLVIGSLSIIVGIILGTVEIADSFSSKTSTGTISNILERKSGTEYSNVEIGDVYPCKLEITYKDDAGIEQMGKTPYETEPCSRFFTNYYKIGDKVNIVYSEKNRFIVKINSLFDRFGFLIVFPLFGLGLIYYSRKLR